MSFLIFSACESSFCKRMFRSLLMQTTCKFASSPSSHRKNPITTQFSPQKKAQCWTSMERAGPLRRKQPSMNSCGPTWESPSWSCQGWVASSCRTWVFPAKKKNIFPGRENTVQLHIFSETPGCDLFFSFFPHLVFFPVAKITPVFFLFLPFPGFCSPGILFVSAISIHPRIRVQGTEQVPSIFDTNLQSIKDTDECRILQGYLTIQKKIWKLFGLEISRGPWEHNHCFHTNFMSLNFSVSMLACGVVCSTSPRIPQRKRIKGPDSLVFWVGGFFDSGVLEYSFSK